MFSLFKKPAPKFSHVDVQRLIENATAHQPLKHCPFCGGKAAVAYGMYEHGPQYDVCCNSCDVSTEASQEIALVIKQWNRRYQPKMETAASNTTVTVAV